MRSPRLATWLAGGLWLASCQTASTHAPLDAGSPPVPELVDPADDPPAITWNAGPFGAGVHDVAGPFVLPLADGSSFDFQGSWTGLGSHLFVVYSGFSDYAAQLWSSPARPLLEKLPAGAHVFFLSADESASYDWLDVKSRVDAALGQLSAEKRASLAGRIHFVPTQATKLEGWIGDHVRAEKPVAFAIDRFQRLREVGLLANVAGDQKPKLEFLADEARGFDFEARREWLLSLRDATAVNVFKAEKIAAWTDRTFTVTLPTAAELAKFDTLELDFTEGCEAGLDRNCGDWDLIVDLFVCDRASPDKCDARLGRWITTYKRIGRWVTDVSSLLPLLGDGGETKLKLSSGQSFTGDLSLRFSTRHKGVRPVKAIPLFGGGAFDQHYNEARAPIAIEVPASTRRVEIVAAPSGHGFGDDQENCAEFCNHEHRFEVNGAEFVRDFPEAGSNDGCRAKVGQGVVPNQFGTWPLGRGGWCPGWDVAPWVADVTSAVVPGASNEISYRGTFRGADYTPVRLPNGNGFAARIDLASWIVLWE